MKPKSIGIVGGAGPLAGALLLERVLSLAGSLYGCHRDKDFPKAILLSYPFSEMLTPKIDQALLRKELRECLEQLRKNGAEIVAIACNTLHAFLDENENLADLVHIPLTLAKEIPPGEIPLVLCTSTSVKFGVHKRFFLCEYPDAQTQTQINKIIDRILLGADHQSILKELLPILEFQKAHTIILGCTELSQLRNISLKNKIIIDPIEIIAKKLLARSFLE